MASTPEQFMTVTRRHEEARRTRLSVLARISDLCERGQRVKAIPTLMANLMADPDVAGIHLWQLDSAMFGTSRYKAKKLIREVRERTHDTSHDKDGTVTVGWALDSPEHSVRMVTWLWLVARREGMANITPPVGFPYSLLYDDVADAGMGDWDAPIEDDDDDDGGDEDEEWEPRDGKDETV